MRKETLKRVDRRETSRTFEPLKKRATYSDAARFDFSIARVLCDFPFEFASQFEELRLLAANRVEGLARTLFEESFFFVEPALRFEES